MCMRAERFARREETRIAAASVGFYRAAVIHHSPGLQPWVNCTKGHALKALPTPRTRGAIPNWRSTPILPPATLRVAMRAGQNSITPLARIRGRGRRRGRERSASRVASEVVRSAFGVGLVDGARCWYDCWNQYGKVLNPALGRHFQGASSKPRHPGLKPWAVLFSPFGGTKHA
jgi:hypothetical protein